MRVEPPRSAPLLDFLDAEEAEVDVRVVMEMEGDLGCEGKDTHVFSHTRSEYADFELYIFQIFCGGGSTILHRNTWR